MHEFKQYIQNYKQINIATTWLLLAAALVLLLPTTALSVSGLDQWVTEYRGYISIIVISAVAYFIALLLVQTGQSILEKQTEIGTMNKIHKMVKVMNTSEQAVIREFIIQKKDIISLPLEAAAVANLVDNCILVPALNSQEIIGSGSKIKLCINIKARPLLDHKALGFPTGKMTELQAQALKSARPAFAKEFYIRH
ncbi:super-infection exclusion protein B [Moritella sp.]|uniref:super-infection exclusion protein B n=1 Tax=Moritella sp. TaxID=78556 RepID=UPI001D2BD93B|nr:super-infection exclusion protein B [Moritella sp.]MCJ8350805.1 superinfection exclusion B family protein [Moritella sp.]NQZ40506.1 super-infection exclusion protein B [Moritella sp.]